MPVTGGSLPIGGVTPPGKVGMMPVGGFGSVPMGGFTPPGNIGVSVEKPGNSLPIGGTTRPGGLRLGKVICGGSVIPAFWFWVSSRQSLLPVVS